jgi:hypothetical protein
MHEFSWYKYVSLYDHSGRVRVNYDDLSQAEVGELLLLVRRYLEGSADIEELPIDSIKRIKETYRTFKAVALAGGLGAAVLGPSAAAQAARSSTVVSVTCFAFLLVFFRFGPIGSVRLLLGITENLLACR